MPGSSSILNKICFFINTNPGFQQNHSTVTQLCFLVHQWHMVLEEGANVQSVFLDLSKAYDRVSINALLSKLYLIGFKVSSDTIIGWGATLIFKLSKMKLFRASQSSVVHLEAVLTSNQSPV